MKKLTTDNFIEKARRIHGNAYDYSITDYKGWDKKVKIICAVHGTFEQLGGNHLVGKGCRECAKNKIGNQLRSSRDEFISKAIAIHGNKYSYDKVIYQTARSPVKIICPAHGSFVQVPDVHLRGSGCPICGSERAGVKRRIPQKDFIERAITLHNDKYDYSLVHYINNSVKVSIICPYHGLFCQSPNHHLQGQGCSACAGKRKLTKDVFIQKARAVHGGRYRYESAPVNGRHRKVKILCSKHGYFLQTPANHLKGHGCPECGGRKQLSTAEFIEKARDIHGDKYTYDLTEYKNSKSKLTIICPDHGPFKQTPGSHFAGNGCASCSGNKKYDNDSFITKAKTVHDNKYDYNLVNLEGGRTNVTIICPIHGPFDQTPIDHLQGRSCPKCGKEKPAKLLSLGQDEFIKRAAKIHSNKYDLSKVNYINHREKIEIICPEHGAFTQRAGNHLAGIGCPGCAVGGFDQTQPAILYYLRVESRTHTLYKIGITNRTVYERFFGEDARKITVLKTWFYENGTDALSKEKEILKKYREYRYKGKDPILRLAGDTELFHCDVLGIEAYNL